MFDDFGTFEQVLHIYTYIHIFILYFYMCIVVPALIKEKNAENHDCLVHYTYIKIYYLYMLYIIHAQKCV